MKEQIISMLIGRDDYLSGEEISKKLGVSRTAIWKHIKELEQEGLQIEAHPKKGYKLVAYPDIPAYFLLKPFLSTSYCGQTGEYHEIITSTNDRAKEIAGKVPEGYIVTANAQAAGRGRLGRKWESPRGQGLYFSLILYPYLPPYELPKLTLLGGLALSQTLEELGLKPEIKWPNDILLGGRKVSGILTEMAAEAERTIYAVVGVGVNIEPFALSQEFSYPATSLKEQGIDTSRIKLLAGFLGNFEKHYEAFKMGEFRDILQQYEARLAFKDKEVKVVTAQREYQGKLTGIAEDGSLIISDGEVFRRFAAGEISLRWSEEG